MKSWPFLTLLMLLQQPSLLIAQDVEDSVRRGEDALADGLWEIAEMHFRSGLRSPSLDTDAKARLAIRLAETMIRSGKPADALELLDQSFLSKIPETLFWKAQATAGEQRFAQAGEMLTGLLAQPNPPYREEAAFTLASIQLALGLPDDALRTLGALLEHSTGESTIRIHLYEAEILLDLDRVEDARRTLPGEAFGIPEKYQKAVEFLDAQILLKEGNGPEAQIAFQQLVNQPQGQSRERNHAAVIGLADAMRLQGNSDGSSKILLGFIQDHPESPLLDSAFSQIIASLPEKPAFTDPSLERLNQWITPPALPATGMIATDNADVEGGMPSAFSEKTPENERLAFALFTRAVGLHRVGTPEAKAEALRLFHRLRAEFPAHLLVERSLYQQARWLLDDGMPEKALALLDMVRDSPGSPLVKGEAAFLEARISIGNGDTSAAIRLFEEAAKSLEGARARSAKLQAAITRFRSGDPAAVKLIQSENSSPLDRDLEANLELERALAITSPEGAKTALTEFITRHPTHPRVDEARLAAAEASLTGTDADPEFAMLQIGAVATEDENGTPIPPQRIALVELRAIDLMGNAADTIAAAQKIIDTYPGDPVVPEATFIMGRNLFDTGSYNQARLVLEALAAAPDAEAARSQAAWLLSARAAALGATPQSKIEALTLFDKAIGKKGPVTSLAHLEKARHLIDLRRQDEAATFLATWIKTLPENDPLQLPAGLLLGEALSQGGNSNEALLQALTVYDKLLEQARAQPALFNRLQYLRGLTLELLPDERDPSRKREGQALQAYYSVLETTTQPAEWKYFDLCGRKALALLEKAGRWEAAIAVAKKIASFNGPGAEEAANRAKKLQLEHMPWDD